MTAPLPHWRVTETDGATSTVEFDLPDFTKGQLTIASRMVGTAAMDTMIRHVIARREETKDQLREGF